MAARFTGRLFFFQPAGIPAKGFLPEPGSLVRFAHTAMCLQRTSLIPVLADGFRIKDREVVQRQCTLLNVEM
jgi:hypothetical protein